MKSIVLPFFAGFILLSGCNEEDADPTKCENDHSLDIISTRNFEMGFSTWSFGPNEADRAETYQFISSNADIYSEQIDNKIPWNSLINDSTLPSEFTDDIAYRVSEKISGHKLLLSVSFLNTDRSDLLEDYDGTVPDYTTMNDSTIEKAYFRYLEYLINQFHPDYLVIAMEANDLKLKSEDKWSEYKLLMANIRDRLKADYPDLAISESVTLHNWFKAEVVNQEAFITEISNYINQNLDFAAISFYPFFKGLHTKSDFQKAFDFLHSEISVPIAFVETTHLAEELEVGSFNLSIASNVCEQKDYLETLLLNAYQQDYEFIIWWAFRDYDRLWETFPAEYQDIGKLWRDTGLLDEDGNNRPAYFMWNELLEN